MTEAAPKVGPHGHHHPARRPRRDRRLPLMRLCGVVMLGLAVCGCPQRDERQQNDKTANFNAELERLRALPYAGGVRGSEDDRRAGVIQLDPERAYPGYTLYGIQYQARAELIDLEGHTVRSWSYAPGGEWLHCELLPDGDLLVIGSDPFRTERQGPGPADNERYIMRLDWNNHVVWKRQIPVHHFVEVTPLHQLLTLTLRRRIIPDIDAKIPVRDDMLALLDLTGKVMEEVSIIDVLTSAPAHPPVRISGWQYFGGSPWIDPIHANSVQWIRDRGREGTHPIFEPGNVLTCMRHQDIIAVINLKRRELVWTWGRGELSGPHDAQLLANGNIMIFDNGINPDRQWSRVIEMNPLNGKIVWEYHAPEREDFFTIGKGTAQRLPNRNTLIESSDQGWAFEVTRAGDIVWEFLCPQRNPDGKRATIVRTKRYEESFIKDLFARFQDAADSTGLSESTPPAGED